MLVLIATVKSYTKMLVCPGYEIWRSKNNSMIILFAYIFLLFCKFQLFSTNIIEKKWMRRGSETEKYVNKEVLLL